MWASTLFRTSGRQKQICSQNDRGGFKVLVICSGHFNTSIPKSASPPSPVSLLFRIKSWMIFQHNGEETKNLYYLWITLACPGSCPCIVLVLVQYSVHVLYKHNTLQQTALARPPTASLPHCLTASQRFGSSI